MLAVTAYPSTDSVLHDDVLFSLVSGFDDQSLPIAFSLVSDGLHGHADVGPDGDYTYTPETGYVGPDSFVFEVTNGTDTDTATVDIDVFNTAPVAESTSESASHDDVFNSWTSGYDEDNDAVAFTLAAAASNGEVSLASDGSYTYTPNPGYVGPDSFDFCVSDGFDSATATVSIDVFNVSTPVADDAGEFLLHDRPFLSAVTGSDVDLDPLFFSLADDGAHGHAVINADGSYTYTPNAGYVGDDVFFFTVTDGAASDTGSVDLDIYDTAPDAFDDYFTTLHDTPLTNGNSVVANDSDGDPLTATLLSAPAHGQLTSFTVNGESTYFRADGTFEYTPDAGYVGPDSFTYLANDGAEDTLPATVSIDVTDNAPTSTAIPDVYHWVEDAALETIGLDSYFADADMPDETLTYSVVANSNPGLFTSAQIASGTSDLTLAFVQSQPGAADITVRATDGAGEYTEQTFGVYDVAVTGYTVEYHALDGSWVDATADEVVLYSDELRWTAQTTPAVPAAVTHVDWLKAPWDTANDPSPPWETFAAGDSELPALGNPGTGVWGVTPKVFVGGIFAMLAAPKKQTVEEIVSIAVNAPAGAGAGAFDQQNPVDLGGGDRFFPGKLLATDQNAVGDVTITVEVKPAVLDLPLFLLIRDADDPTPNDRSDGADNWGTGDPLGVRSPRTSIVVGGENPVAFATFNYTTSMNPGDNYRFAAMGRRTVADEVYPKIDDDQGRLFHGRPPYELGDEIIDEQNPLLDPNTQLPIVISAPLVTVWRRLHVEMDSMAAPPQGTQFTATDLTPGGALSFPADAMTTLTESLQPAFILPEEFASGSQNNLQFSLGAQNQNLAALNTYMYSYRQSMSAQGQEDNDYWAVYIAAIYEMFAGDAYANDNDLDTELAFEGWTQGTEPEYSVINNEVIRDVGAEWGWTAAQVKALQTLVFVHEIGHQFELVHPPGGLPNVNDVMAAPKLDDNDQEALIPKQKTSFTDAEIYEIRKNFGKSAHP